MNQPHLLAIGRVLKQLFSQFVANQGILNASALTYTTLFAVVPLMTVSYSIFSAIPSFDGVAEQFQSWVFAHFVPASGEVVQDYLSDFTSKARSLTAVGVVTLAVTAILMMRNIESALNRIWQVKEARKGVSSFLLYWAILSLGPILIGLGMVVTSYVASLSLVNSAADFVGRGRLLSLVPMGLSAVAFTLLYAAVPNCRVPLKSAVIGGVCVAILFETAKRLFALFVTQFPSYELIYGAFAAVPLFLLWIYISWVIILLGAELTRAITLSFVPASAKPCDHLHHILEVLHLLWRAQQEGLVVHEKTLFTRLPQVQGEWDEYLRCLQKARLVTTTNRGQLLLSRDLSTMSLEKLVLALPWPLPKQEAWAEDEHPWKQAVAKQLIAAREQRQECLSGSLTDYFKTGR
ncbi:MAG: YihY family inner membrane protein [Pontibacterium sp.]